MAEATIEGRGTLGQPETAIRRASPTAYQTFSRKLAPSLTGIGGALVILGGLGTWIRIARSTRVGENLKDVGAAMGYSQKIGWILAGLGVLALAGAVTWFATSFLPKLVPILVSVAVAALTAQRLRLLSIEIRRTVAEATKKLGFTDFQAGFGWGAWMLLIGSILLLLAAVVGLLREMDLRRGIAE